jgi:hypothetical protein
VPALPNLLIIGAAKCGTTSLHEYLAAHPQISMSSPKELRFFNEHDWRGRLDWYRGHFDADAPVRGESSPRYTQHPYRPHVPERIASVAPDARLIYVVGDPIERIVSHWVHRYAIGERNAPLDGYIRDAHQPANVVVCPSRYHTQVQLYLRHFPGEQLLVLDQHDIRADRTRTLREAFRFLGVDESFESPAFATEHNSRSQHRALTRVGFPLWNRVLGPAVRRLPEPRRTRARERLLRMLSRPVTERPRLTPAQHERLRRELQDEVDQLRELTGKRFASWSL